MAVEKWSYVVLNKVGKKEKGSHSRMEVDWYRTRVLVERMAKIEEEEIPISWFSWVEIPSLGVARNTPPPEINWLAQKWAKQKNIDINIKTKK